MNKTGINNIILTIKYEILACFGLSNPEKTKKGYKQYEEGERCQGKLLKKSFYPVFTKVVKCYVDFIWHNPIGLFTLNLL